MGRIKENRGFKLADLIGSSSKLEQLNSITAKDRPQENATQSQIETREGSMYAPSSYSEREYSDGSAGEASFPPYEKYSAA
jgi:hypothetical protein